MLTAMCLALLLCLSADHNVQPVNELPVTLQVRSPFSDVTEAVVLVNGATPDYVVYIAAIPCHGLPARIGQAEGCING